MLRSALTSTLNSALSALGSLLWPECCAICGSLLEEHERFLCLECTIFMPRTLFHTLPNNPMAERMRSLTPSAHHAAALFYFHHKSHWRAFIHDVKYRNGWYKGRILGYHYGAELAQQSHFADIDMVIPVPLHPLRRIKRGYNQAEYIAEGIATALNVKLQRRALSRVRNNPSQTKHNVEERWINVDGLFSLRKGVIKSGMHILLVDDVFTTGATINSAIETIATMVPDARVSVATLAVSAKQFGLNA